MCVLAEHYEVRYELEYSYCTFFSSKMDPEHPQYEPRMLPFPSDVRSLVNFLVDFYILEEF